MASAPPFDPPEARAPAELADGGLARLPSSRRVVTVDRRVVTAAARVATAGHLAALDARDSPPLSGDVERSTKAGAETPATQAAGTTPCRKDSTLNEGRGRDPGDTPPALRRYGRIGDRSTKAGAETPATRDRAAPSRAVRSSLNEGRGRDPGDTSRPARGGQGPGSLNEGRGRDPGDTS